MPSNLCYHSTNLRIIENRSYLRNDARSLRNEVTVDCDVTQQFVKHILRHKVAQALDFLNNTSSNQLSQMELVHLRRHTYRAGRADLPA